MKINIPFSSEAGSFAPLQKCVERAARETCMSEYQAALVMSYYFEELAEQVSLGRVVRVPGFGAFGPLAWTPRKPGLLPYCYPGFSASRGFRNQVALCCSAGGSDTDAIRSHRRHHHLSSRPDRCSSRVFSAMQAFRRQMIAQAREGGCEV